MYICDCMYTQQEDGSCKCKRCHGDVYACECPLQHSLHCPYNPENNQKGTKESQDLQGL